MSTFENAIPVVLKHEGHWVCNPNDPGGETNFGISTLIIEREGITNEFIGLPPGRAPGWLKALKVEAACKVYRQLFWERYRYGSIDDQTVATKIFDAAVNMGAHAHAIAQHVVGAQIDGVLGPQSFAAINAFPPRIFVIDYSNELADHYRSIVFNRPASAEFLSNWLKRAAWGVC